MDALRSAVRDNHACVTLRSPGQSSMRYVQQTGTTKHALRSAERDNQAALRSADRDNQACICSADRDNQECVTFSCTGQSRMNRLVEINFPFVLLLLY